MIRALFALIVLTMLPVLPMRAHAEPGFGTRPTAVVELFTSQGCSSCPPADAILSSYARTDEVLALAWHVDYWNYLGWDDTFSDPAFTKRQQLYAKALGQRTIYTPQAVVNGRNHAVGSKKSALDGLIADGLPADASSPGDLPLEIEVERKGDTLAISVESDAATARPDCAVWLIHYRARERARIARGENGGRSIDYHNIVRAAEPVGRMADGRFKASLSFAEMGARARSLGSDRAALLVQEPDASGVATGRILGALRLGQTR